MKFSKIAHYFLLVIFVPIIYFILKYVNDPNKSIFVIIVPVIFSLLWTTFSEFFNKKEKLNNLNEQYLWEMHAILGKILFLIKTNNYTNLFFTITWGDVITLFGKYELNNSKLNHKDDSISKLFINLNKDINLLMSKSMSIDDQSTLITLKDFFPSEEFNDWKNFKNSFEILSSAVAKKLLIEGHKFTLYSKTDYLHLINKN